MKYFLLCCVCGVMIPQVLESLHNIIRKTLFSSIETSSALLSFHCSVGSDYVSHNTIVAQVYLLRISNSTLCIRHQLPDVVRLLEQHDTALEPAL